MTDPEPSIRITLSAIYKKVEDVERAVNSLPGEVSDHEVRIRAIEKYLWIWIGASGVLGAGASQLVAYLINR